MEKPYTHTIWRVKPNMEDEFVERWKDWAAWSRRQGLTAHGTLMRDVEGSGTFISFGPWESIDAVRRWRFLPEYQERVARLREAVETFEPRTFVVVAEV